MKNTKFRGQRVDNCEWVYGYLFMTKYSNATSIGLKPCIQVVEDGIYYSSYEVKPETVGQFTGLLDKNGKEIYEGDILKMQNVGWKHAVVIFHNGCFAFFTDESNYLIPLIPQYWEEGEIFGNKFQNAELLQNTD